MCSNLEIIANGSRGECEGEGDGVDANSFFSKYLPLQKKENNGAGRSGVRVSNMKDDLYYRMDHRKRGHAVIFNHKKFDSRLLKERNGTDADCANLEKTLTALQFEVFKYLDLTAKQVFAVIDEVSSLDHSDCDCLFIAILSHGEQGIIHAKDTPYTPDQLMNPFTAERCPSLAGKPKLMVVQACQGDKLDPGVEVRTAVETDSSQIAYRIPTFADFFIGYSTIPGYYSWRNIQRGSWYIQAFCQQMNEHWKNHSFLDIMTFVNRMVAVDFESNVPNDATMHRQKQIPCIFSMLTRLLRFHPKQQL